MKKRKKKTRYCEYFHNCDRDEDCFNGEDCPVFKHTGNFTSLRLDNTIPFPKHRTKEAVTRQKSIDRLLRHAEKLNW